MHSSQVLLTEFAWYPVPQLLTQTLSLRKYPAWHSIQVDSSVHSIQKSEQSPHVSSGKWKWASGHSSIQVLSSRIKAPEQSVQTVGVFPSQAKQFSTVQSIHSLLSSTPVPGGHVSTHSPS